MTRKSKPDQRAPKFKLDATTRPVATNDVDEDYEVGSIWIDVTNEDVYRCVDNTDDAAKWRRVSTPFSKYDGTVAPTVNDDVDLGFEVGSLFLDTVAKKLYVCISPADGLADWQEIGSGSGGGAGHNTIYADTYEVTETSDGTPVTKKTFDYVNDSTSAATSLKLIVGLWMTGGGTATCTFEVDDGTSPVSGTATSTASTEEDIQKVTVSLTTVDQDATVTVNMKLHKTGGTTAHMKFTEVRELFS